MVGKIMAVLALTLATLKAAAKLELLFNKLAISGQ
jgi:hypothetical protein